MLHVPDVPPERSALKVMCTVVQKLSHPAFCVVNAKADVWGLDPAYRSANREQ